MQREALGLVVYPSGYRGAQSRYVPLHADYAHFLEFAIAELEPDDLSFCQERAKPGRSLRVILWGVCQSRACL